VCYLKEMETNTAWVLTRLCKLQKRCTRLATDKVYQLLAHGRWFSPAKILFVRRKYNTYLPGIDGGELKINTSYVINVERLQIIIGLQVHFRYLLKWCDICSPKRRQSCIIVNPSGAPGFIVVLVSESLVFLCSDL
jgi:hypothetical protein